MSSGVPRYLTLAAGTGAHRLVPAPAALDPDWTVSTLLAELVLDSPFLRLLDSRQLALIAARGRLEAVPRGTLLPELCADGDLTVVLAGQLELRASDGANPYGTARSGALIEHRCIGTASDDAVVLRVDADLLGKLARP